MIGLRRSLLRAWKSAQPYLEHPRLWVARFLRLLLRRTTFIAITGSNGKTTATRFLAEILSSRAPTQWTRLNRNGPAGFTETIAFCNPLKTRYAVFEVAAGKPGAIDRAVRLIRPRIAVVLSVFLEHRSLFRNIEAVAGEKAVLLRDLPPDGVAVLNADDPRVASMPVPAGRRVIRCGTAPECEVRCEWAESAWPQLLRFTAVTGNTRREFRTRLLGTHWLPAMLSCIAVANELGVPPEQAARVIERVPPYPGRMQVVRLPTGAVVIRDEFKGSAHTVEAAFGELAKATARRKFLAFCDVAESSLSPRKRLAKIAHKAQQLVDYALFIGPAAGHAADAAVRAGMPPERAMAFDNYRQAARFLQPLLGEGDLLLLKADRNQQLSRLFYSMLGEVRCELSGCGKPMVCDDCPEFRNPELVRLVSEELTVGPG